MIILLTTFFPVNGRAQLSRILWPPFLELCSMVTITSLPLPTKSIAPPMPLTILPRWWGGVGAVQRANGYNVLYPIKPISPTGNDPVCQIAILVDLHATQNGKVDVSPAKTLWVKRNHTKS